MKERSLADRIMAILGVLAGTVNWVGRLLWSLLQGLLKNVTSSGTKGGESAAGAVKEFASSAMEKGQSAAESAKQRVTEATHRVSDDDEDEATAQFSTESPITSLEDNQHEGVGGIPPAPGMGNIAEVHTSTGAVFDDDMARTTDTGERHMSEGIPNLEEPGADEQDVYSGDAGELLDSDAPVSDYAGYAKSESDVGVDRSSQQSDLASSPDNDLEGGVDAYDTIDAGDTGSDEDRDAIGVEDEPHVPAAGRGWQEPEDPLAGDPLYGDVESSGTGGEVDLRNDEADDETGSGMHVVSSPNEPFLDDEPTTQDLGLSGVQEEAQVEPQLSDDETIDDVTNVEAPVIDESMIAADATGRRVGDDPASGDLGPERSYDDTERNVIESRDPGEVVGAYGGSGVDDFADDAVAEDLMESTGTEAGDTAGDRASGQDDRTENNSETTQSAAWASSAGIVDTGLTKPQSSDELQTGTDMTEREAEQITDADDDPGVPGSRKDVRGEFEVDGAENDASQAPQYDRTDDAARQEVAAEVAEDIDLDEYTERDEKPGDSGHEVRDRGSGSVDQVAGQQVGGPAGSDPASRRQQTSGSSGSRSAPAGAVRGDGTASCPADYPIKGNARSRVYHTPADTSYEGTIAEFCFATEEDAKAAGFRPRKS